MVFGLFSRRERRRLMKKVTEKLAQGGIDFVVPDKPEIREKLKRLLAETREQLKEERRKYCFRAPELFVYHNAKLMLLAVLLKKGRVNSWDFCRRYNEKWGLPNEDFSAACSDVHRVIDPEYFKKQA